MSEQPTTPERTVSDLVVLRRLLSYLREDRLTLLGVLAMLILSSFGQAAAPALIGRAIDQYISVGDRTGLGQTMLLLLGAFVLGYLGFMGQIRLMGRASQTLLKRLRVDIFDHVQKLPLSYFDRRGTGDLMSRLVNDTDVIGTLFSQSLIQSLGSIFSLAGIIIAMLLLNWQLALATLIIIPLMFTVTAIFSRWSRVAYRETRETLGHLSEHLEENLSSIRESQAFRRGERNIAHFEQDSAAYRDASVNAAGITAAFAPTMDVLSTVATAIVAGVGGWLAFNSIVTIGVVVAFLNYVDRFFRPVQQISTFYTQMQSALAAAERIFELLDTPPTINDKPGAEPLPALKGQVQFDEVSFGYNSDSLILKGLSLTAEPGQTIALVGPTGAGKSTIVNLIGRFYEVSGGRVLVDDHDVRDVTQRSLRQQMGAVPQDSFLFSGTIIDNIRYGQPDAPREAVIAAAQAARARDFIEELPDGYETLLGERGTTLSQGQRQLLCIARAILADPRLLILDEATSNIDTRTERLVQEALDTLLTGRTAFVIAHRLSTIRHADQIVVIDDGHVVEQGKHDELLAHNGLYADLYSRQAAAVG